MLLERASSVLCVCGAIVKEGIRTYILQAELTHTRVTVAQNWNRSGFAWSLAWLRGGNSEAVLPGLGHRMQNFMHPELAPHSAPDFNFQVTNNEDPGTAPWRNSRMHLSLSLNVVVVDLLQFRPLPKLCAERELLEIWTSLSLSASALGRAGDPRAILQRQRNNLNRGRRERESNGKNNGNVSRGNSRIFSVTLRRRAHTKSGSQITVIKCRSF